MPNYSYVAIDPRGIESRGSLDVPSQSEALQRIKEMGLFPTRILENRHRQAAGAQTRTRARSTIQIAWLKRGVKTRTLTVFTRQLATLLEAGMPLLRSLRTLQEQAEDRRLREVIDELSEAIESGNSFTEALELQPKVFNRLYVNMVKAGEIGGALDEALRRLAEFMEKSQKIKGKVKAALCYPCAVIVVAGGIVTLLMVYVLPRFKAIFEDLTQGAPLPAFTRFVLSISDLMKSHLAALGCGALVLTIFWFLLLRTRWGRGTFDRLKLMLPLLGPVFRKVAISRFSRTLGTLISSGVPILQALTIVKETAGNQAVSKVISTMHGRVKEGDPMAPTLKVSGIFPAMVAGMVDVGEQTGALPEMLMKVADNYEDEVDNSVSAMTSLLEPILIVFLAVVVGSIVIAVFLPLIRIGTGFDIERPD